MKQALFTRLTVLFCAVVISAMLLESVAELGHPAPGADDSVAVATSTDSQL